MSGPWIVWDIHPNERRVECVSLGDTAHLNCTENRGYNEHKSTLSRLWFES